MISTAQSTIIVATSNRLSSLSNLLASLDSMEYPESGSVEVLVVANGCTDGTLRYLLEAQRRNHLFSLRVMEERPKGRTRALNLGLTAATGDIILIVDDDVVVDPKWLVKHLECYRSERFDAVQGRVLPGVDPRGRPAEAGKLFAYNIPIVDYGDEIREIRGLTGCNMSFKREVFEKVGFFDVRLGPGASGFSDDTEYSMRIRKAGFKIGYTPYAVAYHELNPERYGRAYNRMIHYRKGFSRSIYRKQSVAFHVLPNLFANLLRYGYYKALRDKENAYKTEGRMMRYWGYLVGKLWRHGFKGHRRGPEAH